MGDFQPRGASRIPRANAEEEGELRIRSSESPRAWSGLGSLEDSSDFGAGAAGSFEPHSQGTAGLGARSAPWKARVAEPGDGSRRGAALAGLQQPTVHTRFTQQVGAPLRDAALVLAAEALAASDNIPTTAAMAIPRSRE